MIALLNKSFLSLGLALSLFSLPPQASAAATLIPKDLLEALDQGDLAKTQIALKNLSSQSKRLSYPFDQLVKRVSRATRYERAALRQAKTEIIRLILKTFDWTGLEIAHGPLVAVKNSAASELVKILLDDPRFDSSNLKDPSMEDGVLVAAFSKNDADNIKLLLEDSRISVHDGKYTNAVFYSLGVSSTHLNDIIEHPSFRPEKERNHSTGGTLLHRIAKIGVFDLEQSIEALINLEDIDINALNFKNETALHLLAQGSKPKSIELILNHSRFDQKIIFNEDGDTPIHLAAVHPPAEGLKHLIASGIYPSGLKGSRGRSPMYIAFEHGNVPAIRALLEQGPFDPFEKDSKGVTMIESRSLSQNLKAIQVLIQGELLSGTRKKLIDFLIPRLKDLQKLAHESGSDVFFKIEIESLIDSLQNFATENDQKLRWN